MSNHFKKFRKAKSDQKKGSIIADWVHEVMSRVPRVVTGDCSPYMESLVEDSLKFTGRPSNDGWKLHEDWFKVLIAHSSNAKMFFNVLGWDYDMYCDPQYTESTTLVDIGAGMKLLYESTGHFPEGTVWMNRRSGKKWKILCSDIGNGIVEFEPWGDDNAARTNMHRKAGQINKFMKRVEV